MTIAADDGPNETSVDGVASEGASNTGAGGESSGAKSTSTTTSAGKPQTETSNGTRAASSEGAGGSMSTAATIAASSSDSGGLVDTVNTMTSSSSGTSSTGGAAETSAGVDATTGVSCLEELDGDLIDDMNDGDGFIPGRDGRTGSWSTTHDATPDAAMFPEAGEPFSMTETNDACRQMAARVFGGPYAVWGAEWGFGVGSPYDMSAFSGISFLARIEAGSSSVIRVSIPTAGTHPWGGVCEGAECGDNFGRRVTLNQRWQRYTLPFDALLQEGWGLQLDEFDATQAYGVKFSVGAGAAFDIWIDDVWLVF